MVSHGVLSFLAKLKFVEILKKKKIIFKGGEEHCLPPPYDEYNANPIYNIQLTLLLVEYSTNTQYPSSNQLDWPSIVPITIKHAVFDWGVACLGITLGT